MNGRDEYILVIPAYNESATIREVVQGALRHLGTVIVVDDGSSDGTVEKLSNLPVTLRHHPENHGEGGEPVDWHAGGTEARREGDRNHGRGRPARSGRSSKALDGSTNPSRQAGDWLAPVEP